MARPFDPIYSKAFGLQPSKGDRKRLEIIQVAIECIATVGIEEMTYEAISKRLGTRPSHIAYYFPNKRELVEAALVYSVATGAEIAFMMVSRARDPREKLKAMTEAAFEWARREPAQLSVYLLFHYYGGFDPRLRASNTQSRDIGAERIRDILREVPKLAESNERKLWALAKEIHWLMTGGFFDQLSTQGEGRNQGIERRTVDGVLKLFDLAVKTPA